jgi:conjugal transfer pilus assembly protein TraF
MVSFCSGGALLLTRRILAVLMIWSCLTPWAAGGPARGWFWYEAPPPPPPKPEPVVSAPAPAAPPKPAQSAPAPKKEPPVLSVKWVEKHLEEARLRAIDDPTTENVGAYLALQKIMFDKARNFALAGQKALREYPALNPGTFVPIDANSLRNFEAYTQQVRPVAMQDVVKKAGLWFFFESTCAFCVQQSQQLGMLMKNVPGLAVLPISIDGKGLPGYDGPNNFWVPDRGQAARLGVKIYPSVVLVWPPNHFAFVAQGNEAWSVIESNILQVAADHGLLDSKMVAWVKPYERGVLTPLQIQQARPSDVNNNRDLLDFVTRSAFDQAQR